MNIEQLLAGYDHLEWSYAPNKNKIPKIELPFADYERFNEIYFAAKENLREVMPTPSEGMPYNPMVKYHERYFVLPAVGSVELVICAHFGQFRFIIGNPPSEKNLITGSKALQELFKTAKNFGVLETFQGQMVTKEEGMLIKSEIESPWIKTADDGCFKLITGREFPNCHHLDLNSSYASRIAERFPELRPMYEFLYDRRKENDGLYKHVLTNSIGAMQSKYCISPVDLRKRTPYALAEFSKTAINGNNAIIKSYQEKLEAADRLPLLFNTDGIWYQGEIFHDERENTKLGGWKNDHQNCRLYIKSSGAYQFIEDGKVNSVVRGYTILDKTKPRDQWLWREIDYVDTINYNFDKDKGVYIL